MKSLHLKIEETIGYDIRNEPIACEIMFQDEKPLFELDTTDSLNFDKSAFLSSHVLVASKLFFNYSEMDKSHTPAFRIDYNAL